MNKTQGTIYIDLWIHFCEDLFFISYLWVSVHVSAVHMVASRGHQIHWSYRPLWATDIGTGPLSLGPLEEQQTLLTTELTLQAPWKHLILSVSMICLFDHGPNKLSPKPTLSNLKGLDSDQRGVSEECFKTSRERTGFECSKGFCGMWELRCTWCVPSAPSAA